MNRSHSNRFLLLSPALLLAGIVGCSGTSTPSTSTITGQIDQASYPTAITQLTLKSGSVTKTIPVDTLGQFSATVAAGNTYELLAGGVDGVPIVVHATSARLDTTFHVRSGGAKLSLGQVHYLPGVVKSGLVMANLPAANPPVVCTDEDGDVDHEGQDGEHSDGEHADDANGHADEAKGQSQGAESSHESTDCGESDQMGMPDNNLPDEIGCGEEEHHHDGGEHEGD